MTLTKLILLILAINLIGSFFKKMQQKKHLQDGGEAVSEPEAEPEPEHKVISFEFERPEPRPSPSPVPEPIQPAAAPVAPPKLAILNAPRRNTVILKGPALQQAFIYSEILGKPVGLRENESTYN
jgi:hypothetical protein